MSAGRPPEIDGSMMCDVYELILDEFGKSSCGMVALYVARKGLSNYSGKPYSRDAIYKSMRKSVRGRKLLEANRKSND